MNRACLSPDQSSAPPRLERMVKYNRDSCLLRSHVIVLLDGLAQSRLVFDPMAEIPHSIVCRQVKQWDGADVRLRILRDLFAA
jgi:hypothetical protein